jgi:very-short-patch-repair endonuclease
MRAASSQREAALWESLRDDLLLEKEVSVI